MLLRTMSYLTITNGNTMSQLSLPDIASGSPLIDTALDWVGMEQIALPLHIAGRSIVGRASAGVSLDTPEARGVHMSRLYLALSELENRELTLSMVSEVLDTFLASHAGLSNTAFLDLGGEALLNRPALLSPLSGWKAYPFSLRCRQGDDGFEAVLDITVGYSSTCPCSAALARQLIQQAFDEDFADIPLTRENVRTWLGSEQGILATPHSQRSQAHISVRLSSDADPLPLPSLIDSAEKALGTALQTAVKRVDEQAFALANGQNLMFCEDAARRLHCALQRHPLVKGFRVRVVHGESLHAHDAVACSQSDWPSASL